MTDKATHPADTPLYPIREVSRITGVNSVTLRAWERRYGLICPQRTPKGHRLYAREDIDRVEQILQWLSRGVPVSQVKELLDQPEAAPVPEPASGDWPSQRRQLVAAVEAMDTAQLERLFNQSLALYPVTTSLDELWQPTIRELEERWHDQLGARLQRVNLETFLRTVIGIRLYHANQVAKGPVVLMSALPDDPGPLWLLLAALAGSEAGYRIQLLDGSLPFGELPLAVERLKASAMVLVSGRAERPDLIRRQLPRLAEQLDVPLGLCGPVARIRGNDLVDSQVELLGDDLPLALARLRSLLKGA
ncbi:MerR family transcriptional regulator [Halomonas sp. BC04]|uniref:MerR family transcriptional regulator n=1 Tax=Halomonas sp. BC04 TaxID=1403540 RepID=UPI0003ED6CBA|nr:MerR family transcriptional regulator [Halomonas sp. BC04]EWH01605.1 MerR family transcriptional regulator [Halomonas sp. BC04]